MPTSFEVRFEPSDLAHARHAETIRIAAAEMVPSGIRCLLSVQQVFRDHPLRLSLRIDGKETVHTDVEWHAMFSEKTGPHIRLQVQDLFRKCLKDGA